MEKLYFYFLITDLMTNKDRDDHFTVFVCSVYSKIYKKEATSKRLHDCWCQLTNEINKSLIPDEYLKEIKS